MFERIMPEIFALYSAAPSSNCFLLTGEKNTLIDTGLKENEPVIEGSLREIGLRPGDIDLILHSHGHSDHFAADRIFKNSKVMMSKHDAGYVKDRNTIFTASALFKNDYYPKIDSFLEDGQILNLNPFSFEVIAAPGHTRGSVCFYEKGRKLLFSGDAIYKKAVGSYQNISSSRSEFINSIQKLSKLDFSILLPAHGPMLKGGQEENFLFALNILGA